MNASAIRAGKAFVEMFVDDATVDKVLSRVQAKLQAFGAAVDRMGAQSVASLNVDTAASFAATTAAVAQTAAAVTALPATAAPAIATTTAEVTLLSRGLDYIRATLNAVGRAFARVFAAVTGSTVTLLATLGGLSFVVNRFAKASPFAKLLNGFLSNSQTTEALGRWTRFAGKITGSKFLTDFGNRIERAGLASSVVAGFQKGGLAGGISASFGAALRGAKSALMSGVGGLVSGTVRTTFGAARSLIGLPFAAFNAATGRTAPLLAGVTQQAGLLGSATSTASSGLSQVTKALTGGAVGGQTLTQRLGSLRGQMLKIAGLTAVLTAPAILAAKGFATAADEIQKKAAETKVSIQAVIAERYGGFSLITPADIQAGAQLSAVMKQLRQAIAAAWAQVGIAALPMVRAATTATLNWTMGIVRLIRDNRALIGNVLQVAAKIGAVAIAIATISQAAIVAGSIFGGLGLLLGAVLSPLGLLTAGVVGLAIAFPELRTEAASVFQFLFGNITQLGPIFSETLTAVQDALMGGNLQAAADVLWAGLKLAWLTGTEQLRDVWRQMVHSFNVGINDAFAGLRTAWVVTTQFVGDAWQTVMDGLRSAWNGVVNFLGRTFAAVIAKLTGNNVTEVLKTLEEDQQRAAQQREQETAKQFSDREALAKKELETIEEQRKAQQDSLAEDLKGRQVAAQQELEAARTKFKSAKEAATALRPEIKAELQAAAATPAKLDTRAKQERQQQLSSSADIRSSEGLNLVLKNLLGGNAAEQTAQNTAKAANLLGSVAARQERTNELLDRIDRSAADDVVSLNIAATAA